MKLLTKEILNAAIAQYPKGSDMDSQKIVAKFFDPQGFYTWYLMNIDPKDNDYAWGIVKGHAVEMGSWSMRELSSVVGAVGLPMERDLYFDPMPAKEVWEKLLKGEHV